MYTSFFIARRYFSIKSKKNLIYRMGIIACLSIALSTMALLLVLSIFNGLEGVIKKLFYAFDPDIKIELKKGKYFTTSNDLIYGIQDIPGVYKVVEVIEDNALFMYMGNQVIGKIKGVSDNFIYDSPLYKHILQGELKLKDKNQNLALIGAGIQYALSIHLNNFMQDLQVFYPRQNKLSSAITSKIYHTSYIKPGAIFSIEKYFDDNYVIVPIDFTMKLLGSYDKRTAFEVQVKQQYSTLELQNNIRKFLPNQFRVLNRDEQQPTLMRTIRIERMLVFITFAIIVAVASLNIFFILSMLVLSKQSDIAILYTLGANSKTIRNIFLLDGLFIGLSGVSIGMLIAWFLGWIQHKFGIISLGMQTSLIEAYPIKQQLSDFVYVSIGVCLITLAASYRPAVLATKINIKEYL